MQNPTLSALLDKQLEPFLATHRIPRYQYKALNSYRACRTPRLGSHSQYCQNGHLMGVWYDSCKRRGCPQCLALTSERWLQQQRNNLLDESHHHWVFTLPHDLLPVWRFNRILLQDILFRSVSETLKIMAKDKRYLAARPAYLLSLHTWGRNLGLHPHIHCLIASGGQDKLGKWKKPKKSILFPAKVMMQLFRGKVISALNQATKESLLKLPADCRPSQFTLLLNKLRQTDWVVHCCKPYHHGNGVMTYLAKYVKKGAFNNRQLHHFDDHFVSYGYQSHQTGKREKQRLPIKEFILRLCDHIPQKGKPSLRYYGLYHPCCRTALNDCRLQLGQKKIDEDNQIITWQTFMVGLDILPLCKICTKPIEGLVPRIQEKN